VLDAGTKEVHARTCMETFFEKIAMAGSVKLADIIDALEMQSDETRAYLNIKTGEVVTITDEELSSIDDDLLGIIREPAEDSGEQTNEIIESEDYLELPDKFEINEYGMMEKFCLSLENDNLRDTMYRAIKGSGAFRRFKDSILRFELEGEWYKYRDQKIKEVAIEWCQAHEISFVEE